mgnify:CR=1 FL=1
MLLLQEEDDEGDLVARGPDDEEGNDEMTEEDRNFIDAGEVEDTRAERVEAIFRYIFLFHLLFINALFCSAARCLKRSRPKSTP